MDGKKANLTGDISAGILKSYVDSYISVLNKILNTSLERGCLPNQLKLVTPVFKKVDELNKENYRFNQMNLFFKFRFSSLSAGFRKSHSKYD